MRSVFAAALVVGLLASTAFAQSSSDTWNGLPDRFQFDLGYFGLHADTTLRFDRQSGNRDVSFEKDLGIKPDVNTFWLDASWRLARRHQVAIRYTRLNRDSHDYTLTRDFVWGGATYVTGLTANATTGSDILGGYYRFAVFRNDRFEIGPTIGVGYLWLRAGIQASGTTTLPGGTTTTRSLDKSASSGSPTGAVGAYVSAWPLKRLGVWSDFLYLKVSPGETDASITDWRIGGNYYPIRNVGLGLQYKYDKYSYDRGIESSSLGGDIIYKGVQVFLSFRY